MSELSPPLKWAGGKRWLIPRLRELWRGHEGRRLVDLFTGGAAVPLGLNPERALLNDANGNLMGFYWCLSNGLKIEMLMENDREFYYQVRDRFNSTLPTDVTRAERAGMFYYLNRTGFNGLCRFNKEGKFNVPFGRHAKVNYKRDFSEHREAFRRWDLSCRSFEKLFNFVEPGDFVYADPPYDGTFTGYNGDGFTWDQQRALADLLSCHAGPVIASNAATDRIVQMYSDMCFSIELIKGPRRISRDGNRTPAMEILATRNL